MRVAIVCDWLIGGGAERVVEQLHKMFPNAPIYTSYCNDEWRAKLNGKVYTGYLQRWPFPQIRKFVPYLRGWWFSRLDLSGYDLVISSSGAEAKFIKVKPGAKHVSYIHAPTHYYWDRYDQYLKHPGFGFFDPLARLGLKLLVGPMRRWDFRAAQRPDYLIANSNYTKSQIKKYYGRDSTVIHPPVDTENFRLQTTNYKLPATRKGFVIAGRQTPYKRFDLAVSACTELGLSLTVIGSGPDQKRLLGMAGLTISFVQANDTELAGYFHGAEAFIFPGVDDFGVVAVEAMAAGAPVIAFEGGGALDYVVPGKTGIFFQKPTASNLGKVLKSFKPSQFNSVAISKQAEKFGLSEFHKKMREFLKDSSLI